MICRKEAQKTQKRENSGGLYWDYGDSGGANGKGAHVQNPYFQQNQANYELPWHNLRWNYLFCDGHVQLLRPEETIGTGDMGYTSERGAKGMWTRMPRD